MDGRRFGVLEALVDERAACYGGDAAFRIKLRRMRFHGVKFSVIAVLRTYKFRS